MSRAHIVVSLLHDNRPPCSLPLTLMLTKTTITKKKGHTLIYVRTNHDVCCMHSGVGVGTIRKPKYFLLHMSCLPHGDMKARCQGMAGGEAILNRLSITTAD